VESVLKAQDLWDLPLPQQVIKRWIGAESGRSVDRMLDITQWPGRPMRVTRQKVWRMLV